MPNRNQTYPPFKREPGGSFLAPGIRERTEREFMGPLRPGIAGSVGARGGAVADASRQSDLGTDHLGRDNDAIGQVCKHPDVPLISDRGGRRASRDTRD